MDDAESPEGDYYQRYRVCQAHLTLSVLLKESVPQRFCQVPPPVLTLRAASPCVPRPAPLVPPVTSF